MDALAHAYQQVRATRTATLRLLQGVRGRVEHARGFGRTRSDDAFLEQVLSNAPERAADVALVRRALGTSGDRVPLPEVGAALHRIESSFSSTTSLRA